jgi:hypothetical protein
MITTNRRNYRQTSLLTALGAAALTLTAFGCGGGGGTGGGNPDPTPGRGVMGQGSPYSGFIAFQSSGSCNNTGYYLTLSFDEDEQGNLTGKAVGRKVGGSAPPPPEGDDKYKGPLKINATGTRTGDDITFTLSGDIQGTFNTTVKKGSGFSKLSGDFDDIPGCTDSKGAVHGAELFLVGHEVD